MRNHKKFKKDIKRRNEILINLPSSGLDGVLGMDWNVVKIYKT